MPKWIDIWSPRSESAWDTPAAAVRCKQGKAARRQIEQRVQAQPGQRVMHGRRLTLSQVVFFWSYISIKLELRCWRVTRNLILRGNPCFARNTCNPAMPLGAPNCASTCTRWYMWTYMNCLCWTCWQVKQFEVWHVSHNLQMKCHFWETHPCPLNISTRL